MLYESLALLKCQGNRERTNERNIKYYTLHHLLLRCRSRMAEKEKGLRSTMSSFGSLKSNSAGTVTSGLSVWKRRSKSSFDRATIAKKQRSKIAAYESEIDNIFQKLSLEKHDDNAAIEILLDSMENKVPNQHKLPVTESLRITKQTSKDVSKAKIGATERKKKFMNRFFFKSAWTSTDSCISNAADFNESCKENRNIFNSRNRQSSNISRGLSFPISPSLVPSTRITVVDNSPILRATHNDSIDKEKNLKLRANDNNKSAFQAPKTSCPWASPMKYNDVDINVSVRERKTKAIIDDLNEGLDTLSNISTLSGSLGLDSIEDIRKCLKEMEHQLGKATQKGKKVSRHKVMQALLIVADSIDEDDEEKGYFKRELNQTMQVERKMVTQHVRPMGNLNLNSSDEEKSELTTSDSEDFTLDISAFEDEDLENFDDENDSPFDIVSSMGRFFGIEVSTNDQQDVEEVLDDLLWTEFVSSRQKKVSQIPCKVSLRQSRSTQSTKGRKMSLQVKEYDTCSLKKQQHGRTSVSDVSLRKNKDVSTLSSELETYLPTSKYHCPN